MCNGEVIIIPGTIPKLESRYKKSLSKVRVLGYSRVIKGTGAGVQIRKKLKRIIADHTNWELIEVSTDYCETENQEATCKSFLRILTMVQLGYIDILIIYLENDIENLLILADAMYLYCKQFKVNLYVSYNNQLLSSKSDENFILELIESQ